MCTKTAIVRTSFLLVTTFVLTTNITWAEPYFAQLVQQGVTFQVESPNEGSINRVTLRASTQSGSIGSVDIEANGVITGVGVDDCDKNGFPEIYVFVTSSGSGSYGSLIAYASNNNKSLSQIYLPPLDESPELSQGYMGHDRFNVGEGLLIRNFPIYRSGDSNTKPSGGTRQIQYRLVASESGWLLKKDRAFDMP